LAFLAVARRRRSVGQKMDENQTAFSVRTEIHCCEIKRGVYTTEQATGWRCHTLSVLLGSLFAAELRWFRDGLMATGLAGHFEN